MWGRTYHIAVHVKPPWEVVVVTVLSQPLLGDGVLVQHLLREEVPIGKDEIDKARAPKAIVVALQEHPRWVARSLVSPSIRK